MKRNRIPGEFYAILIMLVLAVMACGKKDDPMPPQIKMPSIIDLGATSVKEGIILAWSLSGQSNAVAGFKLLRSEVAPGSPLCLNCPQVYRPYMTVDIADDLLKCEGEKGFRYLDRDVKAGSYYAYRIAACDRAGHCGDASVESAQIYTVP